MSRRRLSTCRPLLEALEDRSLPSTVSVNPGQVIRAVEPKLLGVNLTWWDSNLNTPQTRQLVQSAGLSLYRFPGGSSADTWHFTDAPTWPNEGTSANMAAFIASVSGAGIVTVNYGTASPQEDAALLAYFNGNVADTTPIGMGPQWSDASNSWVNVDWKSAGYWSGLRAAAPLAQDDGLNFLRLGRTAPFGLHYFEVGNEIYGFWETDHHAIANDPATYVAFAKQFAGFASQIDPTIAIGIDGSGTGASYSQIPGNFTDLVLQQGVIQGFIPDFISDHSYMQEPGTEGDANLLLHTATDPNATSSDGPLYWPARAAAYRNLITKDLGVAGKNVQLLLTEFNSVNYNPSNQTTSLVNGLWLADTMGFLFQTEYAGATVWDLRNSFETSHYQSGLYGWRTGGDYGLLGSYNAPLPQTGPYVPYPTYFALELWAKMIHPGDVMVQATSDNALLTAYAVKQANGHLALLIVNKNQNTDLSAQFNITGFSPAPQATAWQYGKPQDTAQSQTSDGHASLASFTQTLGMNGSGFSFVAPAYSMTVLDLSPAVAGTPNQNQRFVQQLYMTFLGRPGSQAELDGWASWIPKLGTSAIVNAIARSRGALTHLVDSLYQKFLGRGADAAGLESFVRYLGAGGTMERVIASLMTSPEFARLHGSNGAATADAAFVHALYQVLLGRNETPAENKAWAGQPTATAVSAFLRNSQFRSAAILAYFGKAPSSAFAYLPNILSRSAPAPAADVAAWAATRLDLYSIAILFAQSREFFSKA